MSRWFQIVFDGSRSICHPCWQRIEYALRQPSTPEAPPQSFSLTGFTRAANTSRRCLFDNCTSTQLRQVPDSIKAHLLSYYSFYIPELARVCRFHLMNSSFEDFSVNVSNRQDNFKNENLREIVMLYTRVLERKGNVDFERLHEISEEDLHFWTGMNHNQFESILQETPSLRQTNKCNTVLGVYLCKLRSGEPHVDRKSVV